MTIGKTLKRSLLLSHANAVVKAYLQEWESTKRLTYYRKEASRRNILVWDDVTVSDALRERLAGRNRGRWPKGKGNFHIFLAYSVKNWEKILPISLGPFGKVTSFDWRGRGFDDGAPDWLTNRDRMNAAMLEAFHAANRNAPVDAVVGYLSGYNTSPETLQAMAEAGAAIFNFCWDDKLNFPGKFAGGRYPTPAALAHVVDLNLTNAPDSVVKYAVHDGLAIFWPEAAHPDIHKPYEIPFEFDITFIGGKYGWRPILIEKLRGRGINVICFGNGWENGKLCDEEMVKLYSKSRINLGFAGVGYSKKLMCLKGRDFEVPMSGGLYLTQDNLELSLVYQVEKEIVTYKNEKDCAEKIRWFLENTTEADEIRRAGRKRALRDHNWEKRFEDVFRLAGIMG